MSPKPRPAPATCRWPFPDADVAVVAGDICEGVEDAIGWLAHTITLEMPVVYVLCNHEFYGEYSRRPAGSRAHGRTARAAYTSSTTATIGGVRFLGCTLWTDYMLQADGERDR